MQVQVLHDECETSYGQRLMVTTIGRLIAVGSRLVRPVLRDRDVLRLFRGEFRELMVNV
jgi:hypothetical protein